MTRRLTPKQEMFVLNYIQTHNATQSYKLAGYKASSDQIAGVEGHKLLKQPKIQEAIRKQMDEIKSPKIASATDVLEFLTEVMNTPKNYMKDRIHAAELLGKSHAAFTDKVKTEGNLEINILVDTDDSE